MTKHIWEGVYKNFRDAPKTGGGFSGKIWIEKSVEKIKRFEATPKCQSILPVVTGIRALDKNNVKILDFGGGLGFDYLSLKRSLKDRRKIRYYIVETKPVCQAGRKIFKNDFQIKFYDSLPSGLKNIDIVNLNSSLQYIEDWRKLLKGLIRYKPQFLVLTDLPAGDIPSYVSLQNYYDSKIPVWFFNINKITDFISSLDYKLIMNSIFPRTFFGRQQPVPQDNFPKKFRLGNSCNLIFYHEKRR